MVEFRYCLWQGGSNFLGCEKYAAKTIDRCRVRKFDLVFAEGLPDFVGRQFLGFGSLEKTIRRCAWLEEFFVVRGKGKLAVIGKGFAK